MKGELNRDFQVDAKKILNKLIFYGKAIRAHSWRFVTEFLASSSYEEAVIIWVMIVIFFQFQFLAGIS